MVILPFTKSKFCDIIQINKKKRGNKMEFKDEIMLLSKEVSELALYIKNEEATKQSLIISKSNEKISGNNNLDFILQGIQEISSDEHELNLHFSDINLPISLKHI